MRLKEEHRLHANRYYKSIEVPEAVNVDKLKPFIKRNNDKEADYIDTEACSECKGFCCKSMGCYLSPDDLVSVDYNTIKALLDSGFVSIDWWDYDPTDDENQEYANSNYLRMRNMNGDVVDPSRGGACSILTTNGCPLEFNMRPKGGRTLHPIFCINGTDSPSRYNKLDCVKDWHQYNDILKTLKSKY